jgi:hypothetical protein
MPRDNNIKVRRGAKEIWDTRNPVLDQGEFGFDTTQNLLKIGNGTDNWHNLSVLAQANPLLLSDESIFTSKISIRSPIIEFTSIDDVEILTVPEDHAFLIDSMEVMTISRSGSGSDPIFRFGNGSDPSAYHSSILFDANAGARHILDSPQNALFSGSSLTFGISSASGATIHIGCAVISGHLVKID